MGRWLPEVEYRDLTWAKRNAPKYRHVQLLLFWPVFGLLFWGVERLWIRERYFSVSCALDNLIPFCELFVIPYLFWFAFLVGIHLYTLRYDVASFKKLMRFIIFSYSAALLIYIIFPNCQELRPDVFPRDNFLTRFMGAFYRFDTNTNVCPSLHVIGSCAVLACAWNSKHFSTTGRRVAFTAAAVLISISTVFLKQHSVVDILVALPICALAYCFAYETREKTRPRPAKPKQWRGI